MKKVGLLLFIAAMSTVRVKAQSNTLLVYGNVGFDSQKVNGVTYTNYSFAPGVGYQWNDHWTAGVNLNLNGAKDTDKSSNVAIGPFIRYTQPLAGIFAIYGQFNANYLSGETTNTTSYTGFQGTLFPAIGVNLKNSFALNFTFGSLSFSSQKFAGIPESATSFHVAFGSGAGFGISKNFGLKK
ncbi:outer membrane beta-barrel protein [Spirosoma endophyticum]|uniref:Outer membrane protein beta-barrel domain-containing protein n=1 Tax=Spirosoma endophyticum TaxID=662367 RepID=A0A1I1Q1L3_9BACT|nr:outer membrane beta-barrel protein [Spirosoma endophyticum]SFD12060.1 hypothetical protein SAMN05216167_103390 [Spirosoma endophyticum]